MKQPRVWTWRSLALGLALAAAAPAALGVDGQVLINQAKALAGNVTPGDAPGFPVTLSQPGSYRLSGNLAVPADTDGIQITSPDVTVDLNGFTIAGSGGSQGSGVTSIDAPSHPRITVRNGVVRGMGLNGVLVGAQSRVEGLHVEGNGQDGISASDGSIITGNTAQGNGDIGIFANVGSAVTGNTAQGNRFGIVAFNGCTVIGNTALGNASFGLFLDSRTGYQGNVLISNNGGDANPQVSNGIQLGPNVCGTDTICP